jgi:hypothetical protein
MARLSVAELNARFLAALGDLVERADPEAASPLTLEALPPLPSALRVYVFNSTNPPGGRPTPEHKIQLMVPGQGRQARGNFDTSGDRAVVVAGYVEKFDVFVLWDAYLHRDFAFSKNAQVRTATVESAVGNGAIATQERQLKLGTETVIVAPSALLADALELRFREGGGAPAAPIVAPLPPAAPLGPARGGRAYVPPARTGAPAESKTRVFEVDPDAVDRGTTAHKDVQDALAAALKGRGLEPLSPQPGDPQFDIAWVQDRVAFVAEVKSLTVANEEQQLRLGLGQVLSYVHRLEWPHVVAVRAVLAVEHRPAADYWTTLCAEHDVVLTWPEAYGDLFVDPS